MGELPLSAHVPRLLPPHESAHAAAECTVQLSPCQPVWHPHTPAERQSPWPPQPLGHTAFSRTACAGTASRFVAWSHAAPPNPAEHTHLPAATSHLP
mmetsp:Transcript_12551/g.25232  ORF Transcript_12551/g.25232 Transcript_12551/m.25232 type:complete len:97 (-) Transcript_12551:730-1020(-)